MKKRFKNLVGVLVVVALQVSSVMTIFGLDVEAYMVEGCCGYHQLAENNIPKLVNLKQISANQIEIMYDGPVDTEAGTKTSNYWVQDTKNTKPNTIATLGKKDKINAKNALTPEKVTITKVEGSDNRFMMTFTENIGKGDEYKLIICYVTAPGAQPYTGDNGMATFIGK